MKYDIPKSFPMGGQIIKVVIVKELFCDGQAILGKFEAILNEIHLAKTVFGKVIVKSQVEQTYYHEYAHCLMFHCRQDNLNENEELIDLMGEFLYQSLKKKSK